MHVTFKQISANKVTKLFKESAVSSIVKEYTQLEYVNVVVTENPDVLTTEQNRKQI